VEGGTTQPTHRLAITSRCLRDDLGIGPDQDWRDRISEIDVLKAFVEQRGAVPIGQQRIEGLTNPTGKKRDRETRPVFSLHSEKSRAGTWHDAERGVVWLLGVKLNAHDYEYLESLAVRDRLFPTKSDIDAERSSWEAEAPLRLAEALCDDARRLAREAEANRGALIRGSLGGVLEVRLSCDAGTDGEGAILVVAVSRHLYGSLSVASAEHVPGAATELFIAAGAFFPNTPLTDLGPPWASRVDGADVRSDEIALQGFLENARRS
jgi:hypothetical protein